MQLIESDAFPFEFVSQLAERESWRKEIHRPVYHVHKWWAKRLGSVFRGILLGCTLPDDSNLSDEFYRFHDCSGQTVFDPFMGSGTTVGEAHKLGFAALGRDINPVAVEAVSTALGPLDRRAILAAFEELSQGIGKRIRKLYRTFDSRGRACDVLYYFWVMQVPCPQCARQVDLFPSYVIARNAYPRRKPEVQVLCPSCGDIFPGVFGYDAASCVTCQKQFNPQLGTAKGTKGCCPQCNHEFGILAAVARSGSRPNFRLYGKLVLYEEGTKAYLPARAEDFAAYDDCAAELNRQIEAGQFEPPCLALEQGFNTRQAISYGFKSWRDFFNDRQLLALGWLRGAILQIPDESARRALLTLFSGVLEFNNLFASYKGEGTGAVRHMFSHHILKPERTPIEANVWGTSKSSGSFSNLLRGRLLRAIEYRQAPTEVNGRSGEGRVCAPAFSGQVDAQWPVNGRLEPRAIHLSCGDSAQTDLPGQCVDLVVTDPPFFDNVHYSELADFFQAWKPSDVRHSGKAVGTTRHPAEVQDSDAVRFADKLQSVFRECHRILKDEGLLVFTYHHSRNEGWQALAGAIFGAGFTVVNSQPVKAEMSVATPKSQAKEPIQLDIILVCRKAGHTSRTVQPTATEALDAARAKVARLQLAGFTLSRNDRRIIFCGQMLTTIGSDIDLADLESQFESELDAVQLTPKPSHRPQQHLLFDEA